MEATVATLPSNRFGDLIDRFLYPRRHIRRRPSNVPRAEYPAIRLLAEAEVQTSELSDQAWLQRVELRGSETIAQALEASGFGQKPGTIQALFVDGRCGMICAEQVGGAGCLHPDRLVTAILRSASRCHASGIILATNDPSGSMTHGRRIQKLTMDLYRKGEAINVYLLDHFVLGAGGWRRMLSFEGGSLK